MTPEAQSVAAVATEAMADKRFLPVFQKALETFTDKPSAFASIVFMLVMKVIEEFGPLTGEELWGDDGAAENILGRLHQVTSQVLGVSMTVEEFVATMEKISEQAQIDPAEAQAQGAGPEMGAVPAEGTPAPQAPGLMEMPR